MDDQRFLRFHEDGDIIIVSSACGPGCSSKCCNGCTCGCQDTPHKQISMPIKINKAGPTMHHQLHKQTYLNSTQLSGHPSSFSTDGSFAISSNDIETKSLPHKPIVVTPSMEALSRSPANRTEEQIMLQRQKEFFEDQDNDPFPHHSTDTTRDLMDLELSEMFPVADLSDSMQVNHHFSDSEQSMLSSYSSSFAPSTSASGLIVNVGAGLSDAFKYQQRSSSTCYHGVPANRCGHCRRHSD